MEPGSGFSLGRISCGKTRAYEKCPDIPIWKSRDSAARPKTALELKLASAPLIPKFAKEGAAKMMRTSEAER